MADHKSLAVFIHLLLTADNNGNGRISRYACSRELNINPNTWYKIVQKLAKSWQIISTKSNNRFTDFSILNWGSYQTLSNTKSNNKVTTNEQQSNNKVTLYKEENKNKKENIYVEQLIALWNSLTGKNYTLTEKRRRLVGDRLKVFRFEQLEKSVKSICNSPFHMGKNDRFWVADPDFLFKSDEQIDKFLNLEVQVKDSQPVRLGYKASLEREHGSN